MSDTSVIAALGAIVITLFGVAWGLLRSETTETRKELKDLRVEFNQHKADYARADERDKAFAGVMTNVATSFNSLGDKIDKLARLVEMDIGYRRNTPPQPQRSYHGGPLIPREDKK